MEKIDQETLPSQEPQDPYEPQDCPSFEDIASNPTPSTQISDEVVQDLTVQASNKGPANVMASSAALEATSSSHAVQLTDDPNQPAGASPTSNAEPDPGEETDDDPFKNLSVSARASARALDRPELDPGDPDLAAAEETERSGMELEGKALSEPKQPRTEDQPRQLEVEAAVAPNTPAGLGTPPPAGMDEGGPPPQPEAEPTLAADMYESEAEMGLESEGGLDATRSGDLARGTNPKEVPGQSSLATVAAAAAAAVLTPPRGVGQGQGQGPADEHDDEEEEGEETGAAALSAVVDATEGGLGKEKASVGHGGYGAGAHGGDEEGGLEAVPGRAAADANAPEVPVEQEWGDAEADLAPQEDRLDAESASGASNWAAKEHQEQAVRDPAAGDGDDDGGGDDDGDSGNAAARKELLGEVIIASEPPTSYIDGGMSYFGPTSESDADARAAADVSAGDEGGRDGDGNGKAGPSSSGGDAAVEDDPEAGLLLTEDISECGPALDEEDVDGATLAKPATFYSISTSAGAAGSSTGAGAKSAGGEEEEAMKTDDAAMRTDDGPEPPGTAGREPPYSLPYQEQAKSEISEPQPPEGLEDELPAAAAAAIVAADEDVPAASQPEPEQQEVEGPSGENSLGGVGANDGDEGDGGEPDDGVSVGAASTVESVVSGEPLTMEVEEAEEAAESSPVRGVPSQRGSAGTRSSSISSKRSGSGRSNRYQTSGSRPQSSAPERGAAATATGADVDRDDASGVADDADADAYKDPEQFRDDDDGTKITSRASSAGQHPSQPRSPHAHSPQPSQSPPQPLQPQPEQRQQPPEKAHSHQRQQQQKPRAPLAQPSDSFQTDDPSPSQRRQKHSVDAPAAAAASGGDGDKSTESAGAATASPPQRPGPIEGPFFPPIYPSAPTSPPKATRNQQQQHHRHRNGQQQQPAAHSGTRDKAAAATAALGRAKTEPSASETSPQPSPERSRPNKGQQQQQQPKETQPQKQQRQKQRQAEKDSATTPVGGGGGGGGRRPARLRDVLAASDAPDPESITQQYLALLHAGELQKRPKTAPEGAPDLGASKNAAGNGVAAVLALASPSAAAASTHPQRPGTSHSAASGSSSGITAQGMELARLQAKTAWEVAPLQRGRPASTDGQADRGSHKLPPLGGGSGGGAMSPTSPTGGVISLSGASSSPLSRKVIASRTEAPPRNFIPRPTVSVAPYPKIYSPGPGSYSPTVFRHGDSFCLGGQSFGGGSPPRAWAFGGASQRPANVCSHFPADTPGPVYLPSKVGLSTWPAQVNHKFDHNLPGGRFCLTAGQPSNAPMFNPGPGTYQPGTTPAGDSLSPGRSGAMPAYSFALTKKLMTPATDGAALPVLSKEHVREYYGTLSPGPAHYSPDASPTRTAAPAYSVPGRRRCWFDPVELSPGPIYKPNELNRMGGHSLGDAPYATIGKGPKFHDPTSALSASAWLSFNHARRANYGIHSPGPVYLPNDPRTPHVPSPSLATGPIDRFSARNETGRLQ